MSLFAVVACAACTGSRPAPAFGEASARSTARSPSGSASVVDPARESRPQGAPARAQTSPESVGDARATPTSEPNEDESNEDEPSSMGAQGGKLAFQSFGCEACHSTDGSVRVGPTLQGLFGSTVELEGGKSVRADREYLIESILSPASVVVRGYPNQMPAFRGHIREQTLMLIVAYIEGLGAPKAAPPARRSALLNEVSFNYLNRTIRVAGDDPCLGILSSLRAGGEATAGSGAVPSPVGMTQDAVRRCLGEPTRQTKAEWVYEFAHNGDCYWGDRFRIRFSTSAPSAVQRVESERYVTGRHCEADGF